LTRRRKIILIIGSICAVLLVVGGIARLEPFAPRYMGKTVNQWLTLFVQASGHGLIQSPHEDVIKAFGTNALPVLTKNSKLPNWFKTGFRLIGAIDSRLKMDLIGRFLRKPLREASERSTIARIWAQELLLLSDNRDGPLIENLLESNQDDNLLMLAIRFAEACEDEKNTLESIAANGRNETIRSRAKRLLKQYRGWDDATYQKWLASQTNAMSQK
jgi:hypothetical protein